MGMLHENTLKVRLDNQLDAHVHTVLRLRK